MVFDGSLTVILFFVLFAWIAGLSFITFRMVRHYNNLTGTGSGGGLKEILEGLVTTQKKHRQEQKDLFDALAAFKKEGLGHVQRVGLVRFNPFSDTGGSQSFTLAILDGHNSGLVMTSLYARTGHRWYVKEVLAGKGRELALSKEEQTAVQKARPFEGEHHA